MGNLSFMIQQALSIFAKIAQTNAPSVMGQKTIALSAIVASFWIHQLVVQAVLDQNTLKGISVSLVVQTMGKNTKETQKSA